jgi:hypothetical protein
VQSHELLREVLRTTSAKQIAADLNLSLSIIYLEVGEPAGWKPALRCSDEPCL